MLFKTVTAREGLTSSQVNCLLKDTRGYMWFGTPAGLFRYDGYVFRIFQSDSQNGTSLPDSYIESIQEAIDGNLWIKTNAGYCVFDPQSESFERDMSQMFRRLGINDVPTHIYIDRHKNLWGYIKDKGVVCYNMQQQLVYEFGYSSDAQSIPMGTIVSIGECAEGAVLVYEDGRLVCCDVMHQQHTLWVNDDVSVMQLRNSSTLKVFADQMDNLWLYGQGTLFRMNKQTKTWDLHIGDQLGLTSQSVDNAVTAIAADRKGNVWIGTLQNGLIRVNINTLMMEPIQPTGLDSQLSIYGPLSIQSVYIDDTDLLWVGTEKAGVAYWGQDIYKFESERNGDITAMASDADGNIVYGTADHGLIGMEDIPLSSRKVSALVYGGDSSLWVGTKQNGLTRIRHGQPTYYNSTTATEGFALVNDNINDLCVDKLGNVWIATNGGLMAYNNRIHTFSTYTVANDKLRSNVCTSLWYGDKGNRMMVGTAEGLDIISIATGEVTHLTGNSTSLQPFTNRYVTQVMEDSRGIIWVGTREGVNAYVQETDQLYSITERQGLCNNNICGIAEDENHNIWLTTSNGATRIVVQVSGEQRTLDYSLFNYTTTDGLAGNEFNQGAILRRQDGHLLFGSLFGVSRVRSASEETGNLVSRVILTQLFVNEEEIMTGHEYEGNIILPQALNETNHITLSHEQNTVTIKFATGSYNSAEKLLFMYQLEGYDHGWRNADQLRHSVTFTNMSSGTYVLHVKAVAPDGTSSEQERLLEIEVERHWLLSWWMLVLYIIVAIIIIYVWRFSTHQIQGMVERREMMLSELKRLSSEVKAASSDLTQPMARMASILSNLSDRDMPLEEREQLNTLHSQMLTVITRVSDMQMALENPEDKASQRVKQQFRLSDSGELNLPDVVNTAQMEEEEEELTGDAQMTVGNDETRSSIVMVVDDNVDFLAFIAKRLRGIYDLHAYDDSRKALADIDLLRPHIVICKHDMPHLTGSEFCNKLSMTNSPTGTKFLLVTDGQLTMRQMQEQGISIAADAYLAKPFKIVELVESINRLLGLGPIAMNSNLIEGSETRRLESRNSSMTTASESLGALVNADTGTNEMTMFEDEVEDNMKEFSMASAADRQLMRNIEQFVLHNMSRGQLSLDDIANAMGMGRVPLFQKVKAITSGKTPTELVRDLRLNHACMLLQRTDINMEELANCVGFITGERFISIFKDKYGMSPMEYRMQYRKH